ncbi:MAG TPA: phospholipase D-like domain-containing protein [Caulobacteraceae bacterium]|jgi:phosphatidylserine/phosphatidylglycerophosphate/cardiolipin synthase-like enzyme|nr:phospholipase D-like domain-containing protein [Caulobacteraceae bacterium]
MSLLRAGDTCWRAAPTSRAKLLVDGQDYFHVLRDAMRQAHRSIHVLGWSFDPRARLTPEGRDPAQLGHELIALAKADPSLDIRLLIWRSALPISATQSGFPHRARAWFKDTGVRFELDDKVPLGACHHQKMVVIDDSLAFVGGADFADDRWDSQAHLDDDPRRIGPDGRRHGPRHEVMALTDGRAAAMLGALFRERWRKAVGEMAEPGPGEPAPWPDGVTPDLRGGVSAVARTEPTWRDNAAVREIANLTLEAIASAETLIYFENQYFTWPLAVEALAARLAEPDGPEVVLICTEKSPSYFDQITMDRARSTALWRLKSSDVFGRFHPCFPATTRGRAIIAHAKVMAVDDTLLRVSSANLNNRSHGFDTEAELAVEAQAPEDRAALALVRDRLAAHWIDRTAEELAELRQASGSFAQALWALDKGRRLRPLEPKRLGFVGEFIAEFHIGDPTDVSDSWRPARRRERLLGEGRQLRRQLARG